MTAREGHFVVAESLESAQRIALENGCEAVWAVEGPFCTFAGVLWAYVDGQWFERRHPAKG